MTDARPNAVTAALRRIADRLDRSGREWALVGPQDRADLVALRPALTAEDRATAVEAARLITGRGYARDRDLPALLAAYLDGA